MLNKTISYGFFLWGVSSVEVNKSIAKNTFVAIIADNNTPPASRQISAPRGVTRFWAPKNFKVKSWGSQK